MNKNVKKSKLWFDGYFDQMLMCSISDFSWGSQVQLLVSVQAQWYQICNPTVEEILLAHNYTIVWTLDSLHAKLGS